METHSQESPTSSTTESEIEDQASRRVRELPGIDGDQDLSIAVIADISGIDAKMVRRYLYMGVIGSTRACDVRDWLEHHQPNVVCRGSRIERGRVFNKWRD